MFREVRLLHRWGWPGLAPFLRTLQSSRPNQALLSRLGHVMHPPPCLCLHPFWPLAVNPVQPSYELVSFHRLSLSLHVIGRFLEGETCLVCWFRHPCCQYWTTDLPISPSRKGTAHEKSHRKFRLLRTRLDPNMPTSHLGSQRGN